MFVIKYYYKACVWFCYSVCNGEEKPIFIAVDFLYTVDNVLPYNLRVCNIVVV